MRKCHNDPSKPLLSVWVPGSRFGRFMSEIGLPQRIRGLGSDGEAAVLREVRAATDIQHAACSPEYSPVAVFKEANERAGAILREVNSQPSTDETDEGYLRRVVYAVYLAEMGRRQRDGLSLTQPVHAAVSDGLGLGSEAAQAAIASGARDEETCFPPSYVDYPARIAWQLLRDLVAEAWSRHLAKLEAGNAEAHH